MKLQILRSNGDSEFFSTTIDEEIEKKILSLDTEIVESYTINFNDNVTLEQTHDVSKIKPNQIKSIIIKLR